jgi:pilus assembly protein FimV
VPLSGGNSAPVAPKAPLRAPVIAPPPAPAAAAPATEPANLDFDLTNLDFEPPAESTQPTPMAAAAPAKSGMMEFDMNALSVDPDSRSGAAMQTKQPADADADEDPLGTKLALAQEVHAIGDDEGARSLVKEVIAEATGALKSRAERFLAELG